jgi:hypothetical protein
MNDSITPSSIPTLASLTTSAVQGERRTFGRTGVAGTIAFVVNETGVDGGVWSGDQADESPNLSWPNPLRVHAVRRINPVPRIGNVRVFMQDLCSVNYGLPTMRTDSKDCHGIQTTPTSSLDDGRAAMDTGIWDRWPN